VTMVCVLMSSTMKCGLCLLVVPVLFSMLAYRYIQFMPEGAKEPVNQMKTLAIIKISDDIVSLLYNLIKIRCLLNVFFFIYNTIQFRYFQSRTHECRMSNYMYIKRKHFIVDFDTCNLSDFNSCLRKQNNIDFG
jgi:hypothetical protein